LHEMNYTDQLHNTLSIDRAPSRIVSLVPSQTELLYDLGLDEQVIGITKFCIHPDKWFRTKTRVGGTKTIDIDKVIGLQPDLIIANKEENVKEQVDTLRGIAPVYVSDVNNLNDALSMIAGIGEITQRKNQADELVAGIQSAFTHLAHQLPAANHQPSTAYLIWQDPFMAAGGDTFISDMMRRCGFGNAFGHKQRYPGVTGEELAQCDLILLSSEPYPFKEKHLEEFSTKYQIPISKFRLVDGEMFSWYGSRLRNAAGYFQELMTAVENKK
jgi:ABC-type Fe3+-hydroxamate transport system substrate-binding protein